MELNESELADIRHDIEVAWSEGQSEVSIELCKKLGFEDTHWIIKLFELQL